MAPTKAQLLDLWPVPGPSLTQYTAARWPGNSPESTATLRRYLQRDYEEHHGFFDYTSRGAHNHTTFHLLVEWALGGTPKHLDAIWEQHENVERDSHRSPGAITAATVFDHLGDGEYYQAYLYFFSDLLLKTPISAVLEEWIFSSKANFDGKQPQMLNRLLDAILHPMLYLGYGIEFSLPGLMAMGLAHISVHGAPSSTLVPRSVFEAPTRRGAGTHAFSIASRVMSDRAFENYVGSFDDLQVKLGPKIQSYAAEWLVDGANPQEIAKKVQELTFLNVMIFALGGWRDGVGFYRAEFTLLHLLTSSMTLTAYMAVISSPTSKSLLLRSYFTRSLAYYVAQGRPPLPVRSFFVAPILTTFPGPAVNPTASAFPDPSSPFAETPNLWLKIIQSALVHPDDHLSKVQRTLAHYSSLYGHIAAGEFGGTELKDCELIDGTLFLRTAALTMEWMGRIREGEPARFWGDDPNFPEARIY
ncbi:hypothetical protein GALMADRAFT_117576 [Galerina marginata CBS 339.88]|uniref:Uncharacterized protein n=1 Tax=Galerina marginata (strain CBS 339.88) TaxID=685588 RepID=A0A067T7X4_GALM3|nr:hypothetical protein GALMADRAFT_117576 [Galerina marginata CBS 339.88]